MTEKDPSDLPSDLPDDLLVSYDPDRSVSFPFGNAKGTSETMVETQWVATFAGGGGQTVGPSHVPHAGVSAYRLIEMVGKGGFGEVWEAVQVSLDRTVAVKRLRKERDVDKDDSRFKTEALVRSFRQEALTTANLDHPNIVPVHDLGLDQDGSPLLAMKLVNGQPWDSIIMEDFPRMSPPDFLGKHIPILVDMVQAVAFAHSRGVVHRDLKPSQVMVGEFGEVLLMDWGLAVVFDQQKLRKADRNASSFLATTTTATNPAGTLAFMAPEQTEKNAGHIGPWTDVYLLGGTLYYLLTGRLPHQGDSSKEVFLKARLGEVAPIHRVAANREFPEDLGKLAMCALEPDIDRRLRTAAGFLHALQNYLSGASAREESTAMVDEAIAKLADCDGRYQTYGDCLGLLGRAAALWPKNPRIENVRQDTISRYAGKAVGNGDLVLARLQVESMREGVDRDELARQISAAENNVKRRERERRLAAITAIVLLAVMITGSGIYNARFMKQRDLAFEQSDRANQARADSQQLVTFMLDELMDSLRPIGQLQPLQSVSSSVLEYFNKMPAEEKEHSPLLRLQNARALQVFAVVQMALGNSDSASELLAESVRLGDTVIPTGRLKLEDVAELAYNHILLSRLATERSDLQEAEREMGEAFRTMLGGLDKDAVLPAMAPEMAKDIQSGQFTIGTEPSQLRDILALIDFLRNARPNDPSWDVDMSMAHEQLGEILVSRGQIAGARLVFELMTEIRGDAFSENPDNRRFRTELIGAYIRLAGIMSQQGEFDSAKQMIWLAIRSAQEAESKSEGEATWRALDAKSWAMLGEILIGQKNVADATNAVSHAVAGLEALVKHDPSNALWQGDLASAHRSLAEMLAGAGDTAAAGVQYGKSLYVMRELVTRDVENRRWRDELERLYGSYIEFGDARIAAGQWDEARGIFEPLQKLARTLDGIHPNEPAYQRRIYQTAARLAHIYLMQKSDGLDAVEALSRTVPSAEVAAKKDGELGAIAREYLPQMNFLLAAALSRAGQIDESLRRLRQSRATKELTAQLADAFAPLQAAHPAEFAEAMKAAVPEPVAP